MSCSAANRSPPPRPKISVASPQCGQTKALMFSTRPMTGTLIRWNIASAFATSESATCWGVVTSTDARDRDRLGERQLGIGRARRQVDDEVVELAPRRRRAGTAGSPRRRAGRATRSAGPPARRTGSRSPSRRGARAGRILLSSLALGLALDAHHQRDVRAGDVRVEQADRRAGLGEGDREVDAHRALADAALAGRDRDDVLDARPGAAGRPTAPPGGPSRPTSSSTSPAADRRRARAGRCARSRP